MGALKQDTAQILEEKELAIMRGNHYKAKILITELRSRANELMVIAEELKEQANKAEKWLK